MASRLPFLQQSDTDGNGPTKRRRPALSCVECRRRKVKCDRNKPCGPCTRTKSATCTYRNEPYSGRPRSVSPISDPTGAPPQSTTHSLEFDALLNRYIAPGIFGPHGSVTQNHLPSSTISASSTDVAGDVRKLVERVRSLEAKLAGHQQPPFNVPSPPSTTVTTLTPTQFVKSKFYGASHWHNAIEPYEALGDSGVGGRPTTDRTEIDRSSELYVSVLDCKRMARIFKELRNTKPSIDADLMSTLPPKDVCDQLLDSYLRTFEGLFRVFHIPTFRKEYERHWEAWETTAAPILIKIFLVCAIGVPFYIGEAKSRLRNACTKWIQAADDWLNTTNEKSRLSLTGIQIHILLLIARQVCAIDGDLVWIPAGALLHSAMHIGLHRDPSHFPKIPKFHAEMRRRLWATILEMIMQLSLDMGMPPMLSPHDFDTLPPSNINDEDIAEDMSAPINPRPADEFTDTSIQIAFTRTLHLRLEIIRLINSIRSDLTYEDTLRLGLELTSSCRTESMALYNFLGAPRSPSAFQIKLFDTLVRRFVLCLHRPFFAKAKIDPKYYYSRKACLDASLSILAPAPGSSSGDEDDWTRFSSYSVGMFKSFWLYSMSTVYLELIARIEEQREEVAPFQPIPAPPTMPLDLVNTLTDASEVSHTASRPCTSPLVLPPQTEALRSIIIAGQRTSEGRIRNGEANVKCNVFIACAIARIDALVAGVDSNPAVLDAARKSTAKSAELMRQVYREENGVDIDLSGSSAVPAGGEVVAYSSRGVTEPGNRLKEMDWEALMGGDSIDFDPNCNDGLDNWFFGEWSGGGEFSL